MRNDWTDERAMEDEERPAARGHDPDSSIAAQYEDFVPPLTDDANEAS